MQIASVLAILSIVLYLTGWGYIFGYLNYFGIDSNLIDPSFQKIIISNIYLYEYLNESNFKIGLLFAGVILVMLLITFSSQIEKCYKKNMGTRAVFAIIGVMISAVVIYLVPSGASAVGERDAKRLHEWLLTRPGAIRPNRIPQTVDIYQTNKEPKMKNLDPTFYMLGQNGSVIFVIGVLIPDGGRITRVIAIPYNSIYNLQLDALQKGRP